MVHNQTKKNHTHPCPECGGDATRIRDRFPFTTHGSRAFLWIVFGVATAGYLTGVILISNFRSNTMPLTATAQTNTPQRIIPYTPPLDAQSPTYPELQRALDADTDALQLIRAKLKEAVDGENQFNIEQHVQRIRLQLRNPQSNITNVQEYSLFGKLFSHSKNLSVTDPRSQTPAPSWIEERSVSYQHWWPGFHIQVDDPGSVQWSISFDYFNTLSILVSLTLLTALISKLLPKRNRTLSSRLGIFILLFAGTLISALLSTDSREYVMSPYMQPIATGTWVDAERVRQALNDDVRLQQLLVEMSEGLDTSGHNPVAIAVGREYRTPAANGNHPKPTERSWMNWSLLRQGQIGLFGTETLRFDGPRTQEQRNSFPRIRGFWTEFYRMGYMRFSHQSPLTSRQITINILHLILVFGLIWWIWKLISGIHRFRTWRIQRKRVNRGQCIYCGYRATDEALAARWAEPAPGS